VRSCDDVDCPRCLVLNLFPFDVAAGARVPSTLSFMSFNALSSAGISLLTSGPRFRGTPVAFELPVVTRFRLVLFSLRLQTPSETTHLSLPTLQTIFPPSSSSFALYRSSESTLSKTTFSLDSAQARLDGLLEENRAREREEQKGNAKLVGLRMREGQLKALEERWKDGWSMLTDLVGMMEKLASKRGLEKNEHRDNQSVLQLRLPVLSVYSLLLTHLIDPSKSNPFSSHSLGSSTNLLPILAIS
jgi:hypothetical protein